MAKKKKKTKRKASYIPAVGRRKTAVARVRLYLNKKGGIIVNEQPIKEYFPGKRLEEKYLQPLKCCNLIGKHLITAKVEGSGKMGQLGAVVHGISRALNELDKEKFRPVLKKEGFLTRDSRMKERRKIGTRGKARRKKQSPKR